MVVILPLNSRKAGGCCVYREENPGETGRKSIASTHCGIVMELMRMKAVAIQNFMHLTGIRMLQKWSNLPVCQKKLWLAFNSLCSFGQWNLSFRPH